MVTDNDDSLTLSVIRGKIIKQTMERCGTRIYIFDLDGESYQRNKIGATFIN